jgi:hypothetical protein
LPQLNFCDTLALNNTESYFSYKGILVLSRRSVPKCSNRFFVFPPWDSPSSDHGSTPSSGTLVRKSHSSILIVIRNPCVQFSDEVPTQDHCLSTRNLTCLTTATLANRICALFSSPFPQEEDPTASYKYNTLIGALFGKE